MPNLQISHITKRYGTGPAAVQDVSLSIADGDFMCLLGPSGCGKTTMLRMLAGLEHLTEGTIVLGDRTVDDPSTGIFVAPEKRRLGLVFQSYALWPHMTVQQNIAFGLRVQRVGHDDIRRRVGDVMDKLGIARYADRYPSQLSGGQQQRVALARMLVVEPDVLLLDEPLSNLDAALRLEMRAELRRLHREFGTTIVFVTHDQWEAMTLATTIAVLKDGQLQQVGSPDDIYARPVNTFVARFIGNPPINMLPAGGALAQGFAGAAALSATHVGLRPEDLRLGAAGVPMQVLSVMPTGGSWLVELGFGHEHVLLSTQERPQLLVGGQVRCAIAGQDIHYFDIAGGRVDQPAHKARLAPAL